MAHSKNWIKDSIKHPGRVKRAAKRAHETVHAYAEAHKHDRGKMGDADREALTLEKIADDDKK
ncbi:MAG: hypothetical protein ACRDFB_04305 [Rhabdochlamydiaceae bacterium]